MHKLGFDRVDSAHYGLCEPKVFIQPYLLLLCVEGMSILLREAKTEERIHDINTCWGDLRISHLLLTDDNLIFFQDTINECQHLADISNFYE